MSKPKPPIFRDTELQHHFEENGYVTAPLLDKGDVEELRNLYNVKANIELTSEFNETTRQLDEERNQVISDTIKAKFYKASVHLLINHKIMGGTFFIKRARSHNEFPVHQDWNIVDENFYFSALIWCPLQEVKENNGAMVVVPGSHKYFLNTYRSGSIHPPRFPFSIFITGKLEHALKTIELKAGEAIIYQNSLYHGSHPNKTDSNRLIATGSLLNDAAELLYYHWPDHSRNLIQVVDGSNDFYLKYIEEIADGKLPDGANVIKTINEKPFYPTSKDLVRKTRFHLNRKRGILEITLRKIFRSLFPEGQKHPETNTVGKS